MVEESINSFPSPIDPIRDWDYIKTEIEKHGIEVHRISADDTITTDKEVPEEIKSLIHEYATDKGITVKFKTSE